MTGAGVLVFKRQDTPAPAGRLPKPFFGITIAGRRQAGRMPGEPHEIRQPIPPASSGLGGSPGGGHPEGRARFLPPHGLPQYIGHAAHLPLLHAHEERERDRAGRHILADGEVARLVAEALAVEAHQVDRR